MKPIIQISYIAADDCLDCKRIKQTIEDLLGERNIDGFFHEISYDSDEAIRFFIDNGFSMEDEEEVLPVYKIGNHKFQGKRGFPKDALVKAIEEAMRDAF